MEQPGKQANKDSLNARFMRLFMRNQKQFHAYILMMVHRHQDAEDLLQEAAILMLEKFETFQPDKSFFAWGIGISRNLILRYRQKGRRRTEFFSEEVYRMLETCAEEQSRHFNDNTDLLRRCLHKLKLPDRHLVAMRFEERLSMQHIAEVMDRSLDGLYHSFSRIYAGLRECVNHQIVMREGQA